MATKAGETRIRSYKTKGLDLEELRRKKEEEGVELRKSRRDEQLFKRRNISPFVNSPLEEQTNGPSLFSMDTPFELLVRGVWSQEVKERAEATQIIRKQLCVEYDPPISRVIDSGVLPRLIELLQVEQVPMMLFEVCWIITNICGGTTYHTRCVIEAGGVVPLVALMKSPHISVKEQAAWALSNIAGDSSECRDVVLGMGVMDPLLMILMDEEISLTLKRNCTWLLSNLCRGKNPPPNEQVVFSSLHLLARLLYFEDIDVLHDAATAVANLSEGSDRRIERVINAGVVKRLVELLMHPQLSVVTPALRAIGNILTGGDPLTQVVINCSVLPVLKHLLESSIGQIKKETCWALSNVTAGNKVQIQAVIDSGVLPLILDIMDSAPYKTRKEAAWVVLNATAGGTTEQIIHLVTVGAIRPLCDLLAVQDARVVLITLEGLESILRVGVATNRDYAVMVEQVQGMEKIELLMDHPKTEISLLAQKLLDKYLITVHADSTHSFTLPPPTEYSLASHSGNISVVTTFN